MKDSLDMPERQEMGEKCVQRETEEQRLWRWSGGGGLWWNVPLSLSLSTGNSSRREDTGYEGQANRRIDDRRPHGLAPGCRAKPHLNHPPWPLLRGGSHAYEDLPYQCYHRTRRGSTGRTTRAAPRLRQQNQPRGTGALFIEYVIGSTSRTSPAPSTMQGCRRGRDSDGGKKGIKKKGTGRKKKNKKERDWKKRD